jgi:hypothetical protein
LRCACQRVGQLQGQEKDNFKTVASAMCLQDNKISNLKHQITNKSQISIFNDQNFHQSFIASLCNKGFAGNFAVGHIRRKIIRLKF